MRSWGKNHPIPDPAQPPPSPIPTGRGTRSASNEPFSSFLDRSARIPALTLPGAHQPRHSPASVDLRSVLTGAGEAVGRAVWSGREFGVVRVGSHGVSAAELGSVIDELGDGGLGERVSWLIGSWDKGSGSGSEEIGSNEKYLNPSENLKDFASKLEAIAAQLCLILLENVGEQFNNKKRSKLEGSESVLSLYRFNHKNSMERNQLPLNDDKTENESCHEICLSLHIPFEKCQIYLQSEEDHFSFDAGPETIVVTIGKHIEGLSSKKFKCVTGKMIFVPAAEVRQNQDYSFSIELKFFSSASSSNVTEKNNKKIIFIGDQMIIVAIVITLLYKIFIFLIS